MEQSASVAPAAAQASLPSSNAKSGNSAKGSNKSAAQPSAAKKTTSLAQGVTAPTPRVAAPATPASESTGVHLWSPNGNLPDKSTHIGLLSGHTIVIPNDRAGIAVDKRFRKAAIAAGCIPVGMDAEEDEGETFDRPARIMGVMRDMLNGDEEGAFDGGSGKPNLALLSHKCGFPVERSERDMLWKQVELNPDGDE